MISLKLAKFLNYDSLARKLIQMYTLTGTAIFWFFGLIITYLVVPDLRIHAYTIFFVTIIMLVPVYIIKNTIKRHRPEFKDTRFGAVAFDEWSFPSGHATRATYITIILIAYFPQFWLVWILWGVMIMISRLLLGVHYVSDILAGFILSGISVLIMFRIGWLPEAPYASWLEYILF